MLTKMYLTNFLSFKERTEFDFTASKYTILNETNVYDDVLKGALLIGANASGKSNALNGISFLVQMLKGEGTAFSRYRCFYAENPVTTVEYEFVFDKNKVIYVINYNVTTKDITENLKINEITVLQREENIGELRIGETTITDNQVDAETLFLRIASFNTGRFPQEPTLRKLMDFIQNTYLVDGYNTSALLGKSITKYAEEHGVEKLNKYFEKFQYDFVIEYGSESEGEGLRISVDKNAVFFKRKSFPFPAIIIHESQGNQVFADLLPQLISVIEKPGMIVIDEFGNSFHNKLSEKIIRFFMEYAKDSQIFITSHHTNLISNSVFRPDQIDLIIFQGHSGSRVKRLSQFKPREAQNLEKMYLGGMFEGLPIYEEIQN